MERRGFANVLAGSTFASTGVKNDIGTDLSASIRELRIVRLAMRDTIVSAFNAACAGEKDSHPPIKEMHGIAQDLIRLALCVTADVVA